MKIRIKNDAPKSVKCYMKEMKSICGSEQVLCKIFMSNKVQILLERYPGRKQYPNRTEGKKKDHDQLDWQKKQSTRIYWQILSHLQAIDGSKFQVPRLYQQQSKQYSCQVIKSISHINFEFLKMLYLGGNGIVSIESIAFASMPNVEKIKINQFSIHYEIKSFAKTNFNRLKVLNLRQSTKFAYEKTRHLNRARFNMIEEEEEKAAYSDQQKEKQESKQLRTIMKEYAFANHMVKLSVKIPCIKLDYSMFESCSYCGFTYESRALCISVTIQKLIR